MLPTLFYRNNFIIFVTAEKGCGEKSSSRKICLNCSAAFNYCLRSDTKNKNSLLRPSLPIWLQLHVMPLDHLSVIWNFGPSKGPLLALSQNLFVILCASWIYRTSTSAFFENQKHFWDNEKGNDFYDPVQPFKSLKTQRVGTTKKCIRGFFRKFWTLQISFQTFSDTSYS